MTNRTATTQTKTTLVLGATGKTGNRVVPTEVVTLLRNLFGEVLDGRDATITDGVQRALGREPKDFADFAREGANDGTWEAAQ